MKDKRRIIYAIVVAVIMLLLLVLLNIKILSDEIGYPLIWMVILGAIIFEYKIKPQKYKKTVILVLNFLFASFCLVGTFLFFTLSPYFDPKSKQAMIIIAAGLILFALGAIAAMISIILEVKMRLKKKK